MDDDALLEIFSQAGFNGHSTLNDADADRDAIRMIAADLEVGDTTVESMDREKWKEKKDNEPKWKKKRKKTYEKHECIIPQGLENIRLANNGISAGKWDTRPFKVEPPTAEEKMFIGFAYPPSPLYQYKILYESNPQNKYHFISDHRTEPLPIENITLRHMLWLFKVVLNINESEMKMHFPDWEPVMCIPSYWCSSRKSPVDPMARTGQVVNIVFETERKLYKSFLYMYNLILEAQRKAMGNKMQTIMKDPKKMQELCEKEESSKLLSNTFVTHPETIRFYGGQAYSELCSYYDAGWLMGLSLIELYNLHYVLCNDPVSLVLITMKERMINQRHIYSTALQADAQTPLDIHAFSQVVDRFNLLKKEDYKHRIVMGFMYAALMDLTETGNHRHRFVPLSVLMDETKAHIIKNLGTDAIVPSLDDRLRAITELANMDLVALSHPEGISPQTSAMIISNYIGKDSFDNVKDVRVQLMESFKEDAILATSIRRLLVRFKQQGPPPIKKNYRINPEMCSEQLSSILMVQQTPVLIIDGKPGSGKTKCLEEMALMFGPESVLCTAMMNMHINNLYKRIAALLASKGEDPFSVRCGTSHKILNDHRFLCAECIPTLQAERGREKADLQITRAVEKLKNLAAERKEPDMRANAADGLYDYPFDSCMLERVRVLVVEETSLQYNRLIALLLWTLIRCAKNFVCVVFAGDRKQITSLHSGKFIHSICNAFSSATLSLRHCHRFNDTQLFTNAEAISQNKPHKVVFDNDVYTFIETDARSVEMNLARLIRQHGLNLFNTQVICRTNAMRRLLAPLINKMCLAEPDNYSPTGFCVGQIVQSTRNIPPVLTRMLFHVVAVAWVTVRNVNDYGATNKPITGCIGVNPAPDVNAWQMDQLDELVVRGTISQTGLSREQQATLAFENHHTSKMSFLIQEDHKDIFYMLRHFLKSPEVMYEWSNTSRQMPCLPLPYNAAHSVCAAINRKHKLNMNDDVFHIQMVTKTTHNNQIKLEGTVPVLVCREREYKTDTYDLDTPPETGLYFIPYVHGEKQFIQDGSAVTNHTMQGSQSPQVVVVDPHDTKFNTSEWLYTASTRCENRIWYLMQRKTFDAACLRNEPMRYDDTDELLKWAISWASFEMKHYPQAYETCALLELMERARYFVRNSVCVERYKKFVDDTVDAKAIGLDLKRLLRRSTKESFNRDKIRLLCEQMELHRIEDAMFVNKPSSKRKQPTNPEPPVKDEPPILEEPHPPPITEPINPKTEPNDIYTDAFPYPCTLPPGKCWTNQ